MRSALSLRQLEVFLAVARHGQVTRAAQAVHLTQSAVSMSLAQLESLLGAELFSRRGGRLTLTERGRLLLSEAPDLLERVRLLPALLGGRGRDLRGELRIAASTTIGRHLLAPALGRFAAMHPLVRARLSIVNVAVAAGALRSYAADVAYVEGPVSDPELEITAWKNDQMEIVGSAEHWGRRPRTLRPEHIRSLEWVMREPGSGTREVLEQAFASASLPAPLERLQLDDSSAIVQTVAAGHGVACLSRWVIRDAVRAGQLVALKAPFLTLQRTLWRAVRRGAPSGPVQQAFTEFVGDPENDRTS